MMQAINQNQRNKIGVDICNFSLEKITMQISVSLKHDLVKRIDEAAGVQSRSSFITRCIYEYFEPPKTEWEADKKSLLEQIKAHKDTQTRLESDIEFLKAQNKQLTDALTQRLLEPPKKSIWDRLRGR